MIAADYTYARAESVEHACQLLAEHGERAQVLAGGQSLMPAVTSHHIRPEVLIDINRLEVLSGALFDGKQMRIGALTRQSDVMLSHAIAKYVPLLAQAMPHVAPVAVRNRGTFGGSIVLAEAGAAMPACLLALDGRLVLQSVRGKREVAAADFFLGPRLTVRAPDELLIEALIQPQAKGERSAYVEVAGTGGGFPAAGAAVRTRPVEGKLSAVRIVCFGRGLKPTLALNAMRTLEGLAGAEPIAGTVERALSGDLNTPRQPHLDGDMVQRHSALVRRALDQISKPGIEGA